MLPNVYLNLEDDVAQVTAKIKHVKAGELILVCPKKSFLFSDAINLKLLKKQTDLLGKKVYILTMDEHGQEFARQAGFGLKMLPKKPSISGVSDIQPARPAAQAKTRKTVTAVKEEVAAAAAPVLDFLSGVLPVPEQPHKAQKPKSAIRITQAPPDVYEPAYVPPKRKNRYAITGVVALGLIVLLLLFFVILPRGEITVYARSEPLTRDMEISLSAQAQTPDADRLVLPAAKEVEIDEASQSFQSSGKKEVGNKASGTVVIYNFTRQPLNLKAATTSLTIGNKSYVLAQDAMGIRPTAYSNAATKEVNESTLSAPVQVVASQGGETYNQPAGTRLEINNQVFGTKPQVLYAKTQTPITGGTSRFLSYVTDSDIASSRDSLAQQLVQNLRDKIKTSSLVMLDKAFTVEPQSFNTDNPSGTESPTFQADLKAKITGLAFNQSDLESLIANRISQTLSDKEQLDAVTENNLTYQVKSVDLNAQTAVVLVHYEGRAVWNVQLDNVAQQLAGKSLTQANELLDSRPEIDRIDVILSPAWQKTFPYIAKSIKIKIVK